MGNDVQGNSGTMQVFINIHDPAILSYVNVTPHPPPILTPPCAISSELLYQEVRWDNTNTSGFQNNWSAHAQFNRSTLVGITIPLSLLPFDSQLISYSSKTRGLFLKISRLPTGRREYEKAKSVDSRWGNAERATRNTFASADWKGGNGKNLNKGNEDHISGEDINTSRDYKKDEVLPEAKIIGSYRENSEFAYKFPSGETHMSMGHLPPKLTSSYAATRSSEKALKFAKPA
ncbi:hypothetical protein BPAE_0055g00350 [Botrytis paeoniae]|uniref:Uncharacterized protein n=1 Tax=Botrytis paeoniae TaxID=278948 RepID=A0A4Z1FPB4_9HELO|nr:hypothetical protein BPAE_0055g00350 [Botrytis paeoniae]